MPSPSSWLRFAMFTSMLGLMACGGAASTPPEDDDVGAALEAANDPVLYLGVNSASIGLETAGLRAQSQVAQCTGRKPNATAEIGAITVDLTSEAGRSAFLGVFGAMDEEAREWITRVLAYSPVAARDEVAQLMLVLRDAEAGRLRIRRVVFSGHSGGYGIGGEAEGDATIQFETLAVLTRLFPRALGAVEHLAISACNTAKNTSEAGWLFDSHRRLFPKVRSIWAYKGTSPTVPGSVEHLKAWERATRDASFEASLEGARRTLARQGGNFANVRVWLESGPILGEDLQGPAAPR